MSSYVVRKSPGDTEWFRMSRFGISLSAFYVFQNTASFFLSEVLAIFPVCGTISIGQAALGTRDLLAIYPNKSNKSP